MHINALFVCSLVPGSSYVRYDENGNAVAFPLHLATASLLPITPHVDQVTPGSTWWCLHDAPEHLETSIINGARCLIITPALYTQVASLAAEHRALLEVIVVEDPREALRIIAGAWRAQCAMPVVAIAGSIGKTTSIDMLAAIFGVDKLPVMIMALSRRCIEEASIALLHITGLHALAVFEVSSVTPGYMAALAALVRPTIGLITSICPAHLASQGGRLSVLASEQQHIFSCFSPSQIGIVCGDYPLLDGRCYGHPIVRFGLKNKNTVHARSIEVFRDATGLLKTRLVLRVYDREKEVVLPGNHRGSVYGALAAAALAHFLYVPFEVIVQGLNSYAPLHVGFSQRSLQHGRGLLIHDSHSISPDAVKASLHAAHDAGSAASRKIAVIGDIPDLGDRASFWHRHVGRELVRTRSISDVVLVGASSKIISTVAPATMDVACVETWMEAQEKVHSLLAPRDNVLLLSGAAPLLMQTLMATL